MLAKLFFSNIFDTNDFSIFITSNDRTEIFWVILFIQNLVNNLLIIHSSNQSRPERVCSEFWIFLFFYRDDILSFILIVISVLKFGIVVFVDVSCKVSFLVELIQNFSFIVK